MGKCQSSIKDVKVIFDKGISHYYVLVEAVGDCPIGVQGWHHKAFSVKLEPGDIAMGPLIYMGDLSLEDCLTWGLEAPPAAKVQ
jgi:hypothetical protein